MLMKFFVREQQWLYLLWVALLVKGKGIHIFFGLVLFCPADDASNDVSCILIVSMCDSNMCASILDINSYWSYFCRVTYGNNGVGLVSQQLYSALTSLQMGLTEDRMGWIVELK